MLKMIPIVIFLSALTSSAVLAQFPSKNKLDRAEIIVVGEVDSIEPAREFRPWFVQEHNPDWKWAGVKVFQILKGKKLVKNGKIKFLFPASMDVTWVCYPKFRVRDRGVFVLTVKKIDLPPISQYSEVKVNTMTLLLVAEQGDFQLMGKLNEIKKLLKK